jgi:hypothetical protein
LTPAPGTPARAALCQHCTATIEQLASDPSAWVDRDGGGICMPGVPHAPMPVIPPLEAA